jgi:hypothetical protein
MSDKENTSPSVSESSRTGYEPRYGGTFSASATSSTDGMKGKLEATSEAVPLPLSSSSSSSQPIFYKTSSSGHGLFGDSSVPSTLPSMPKLAGHTPADYSNWKVKAESYFITNGLSEIVTMSPVESLTLATQIDSHAHATISLRAIWNRLHLKAFGAIKTAVEPILGESFFTLIGVEQEKQGSFSVYNCPEDQLSSRFMYGNAHYLWLLIKNHLQHYTAHDITTLIRKYMNLKYNINEDPVEFRRIFDDTVRELNLAGVVMPEQCHMAVWYGAIPSEYESLRLALGANLKLKWQDIYEALVNQYSASKQKRPTRSSTGDDKILAAVDHNQSQFNKQNKDRINRRLNKYHCDYCNRDGHTSDRCYKLTADKQNSGDFKFNGSNKTDSDSEKDDDHTAPFIEDSILAQFSCSNGINSDTDELAAPSVTHDNNNPRTVHFIFDSAATTHVTPVKHIVEEMRSTPETSMSTAIVGRRSFIDKRGKVRLNDKWTLSDVAYLPNATASLISEGRLADAGYSIYKNKEFIVVRDANDRVVLRGPRVNRLWVFTINGTPPRPKSSNTIIPSKPLSSSKPVESSSRSSTSSTQHNSIPKKTSGASSNLNRGNFTTGIPTTNSRSSSAVKSS